MYILHIILCALLLFPSVPFYFYFYLYFSSQPTLLGSTSNRPLLAQLSRKVYLKRSFTFPHCFHVNFPLLSLCVCLCAFHSILMHKYIYFIRPFSTLSKQWFSAQFPTVGLRGAQHSLKHFRRKFSISPSVRFGTCIYCCCFLF